MKDDPYNAEFLLRRLMEQTTDSIYFKDLQSRFVMVNKTLATAWGFSKREELIGKSDYDSFKEADARQMYEDEQAIIQSGVPIEGLEEETTWKDGRVAWSSTSKVPLIDDSGKTVGTFGISRNITEHKLAALKAARYAEEIRQIKVGMEEDLDIAAEFQKAFFPNTYPVFPRGVSPADSAVEFLHHHHASSTVSGDLCAIRRLSDTECGILLCDVMGHGIRAALGTALIYATLEELALQECDPGEFLARMNERLLPVMRKGHVFMYATACYAVYNASTGLLRIANAGHPSPLLFREQDHSVRWLMDAPAQRGPGLAINEGAKYQTHELQLQPGDALVLYTDGLYEASKPDDDEEFGEDRLLQAAQKYRERSLDALFPALIGEVQHFTGATEFDDDICLVGLKCREIERGLRPET
ncbi:MULTISPECIES: SpoIIE family protein phosphatase [unclassified Lentimonas]|uniref:SpoIIE family protein phosphatase n=1 Tax=unclassified Lentimonas TaxID=2630993 RepID=UPI0013283404|nr:MULTISPECIES: SpoIIE family protein phosphatase [unclassified Lentimonas]CAA6679706.1 Serine phosphatase RsbU, regulator of sigma subunit [Lentimonas sp. CC4]CAA6683528.1 Serine phosphatase RsbU, regulator of sigma subunit [Lentimonas sp. CC6]CAA7077289.1 Serine phosphatase RsbU, regulator of sigma subunit [Lentimonas sp. CC4]CAA7170196.1 Serine phosphatase RsbU, regulator of sigma subunit [Lentimonas sp. CC21]CAA7182416.1 Serine phosphatase RsbU, regulator of sigma subunit [Lentimonas sp. 